ncbi:MAG TPA: MFS transporter [Flavobacteriaceae bacterium]|nr:MFS transporter [Flavobacteriaceae bacterium]
MSTESKGFFQLIGSFSKTFWLANIQELFERWAWYGIFGVLGIYLTGSTDTGGLGLTHIEKSEIMTYSTVILYLLPVVFGAISDRIGYKISLIVAYIILIIGYYYMGEATTYWSVFAAYLFIAFGAALFKPIPSALVAIHSTPKTVNMGFGVMYAIVNIGGFIGPAMSSYLRTTYGWKLIFIQASIVIAINLVLVLIFYKEEKKDKEKKTISESIKDTLSGIYTAVSDKNLAVLLIIMIGFWTMFNQLFYTLPNFLEDWVDRKLYYNQIASFSEGLANFMSDKKGAITPEWFVNVDALAIIFIQVFVSYFVAKTNYISAMIKGLIISIIGLSITFYTDNALYSVLGIFIFAIGEMATSPTFSSVIAAISPKGKNALYQATYFLPIAAGNFFTKFIAGDLYQAWSDKLSLLQTEMKNKGIEMPEVGNDFSKNEYFALASEKLNMTQVEMTKMIWETYNPNKIWYVIAAIGVVTTIALYIYNTTVVKAKETK